MDDTERYHGLDAARALALLLGVTLHAACSMVPNYPTWAIADSQAGLAPAFIVVTIHIFRMPVFFLMAGFFARLVCRRKGTRYFVKDRLRRILLPLVGGWLIFYPLYSWFWLWGADKQGGSATTSGLPIWKAGLLAPLAALTGLVPLTLGHLWFLYYLLLFYAITLAFRPWAGGMAGIADRAVRVLIGRSWGCVAGAVPLAAILIAAGPLVSIPNPEGLIPVPVTAFAYGVFFLVGWLLDRQPELLKVMAQRWPAYALVFTLVLAPGRIVADVNRLTPVAVLSCAVALATWCGVLAFTGACLRLASSANHCWRYLSDSSYWIYLVHLWPVVFLQIVIAEWPINWVWKLLLLHVAVLPPLIVSYHYLVRPTFIGAILNGRRKPRSLSGSDPLDSRRRAAEEII